MGQFPRQRFGVRLERARGQTRNPYRLSHSPCGSSSGSAVAVAANLASVAIGTETDGSIVCPAAVNGIVGLKPTVGLVSREGIIPISFSQDTAGPMTRSVADAAAVLTAIAGRDDADPATATMPGRAVYDYTARLDPEGLRGKRIGLLRDTAAEIPRHAAAHRTGGHRAAPGGCLRGAGGAANQGAWAEAERTVLLYEFKAGLERYFSTHRAPLRSLADLIAFNQAHSKRELGLFGQELLVAADATAGLADRLYPCTQRCAGWPARKASTPPSPPTSSMPWWRRPPVWRGRSAARRRLPRRELQRRRRRRLSQPQRADGPDQWPAGRPAVHGHRLERTEADRNGLRYEQRTRATPAALRHRHPDRRGEP